MNVLSPVLPGLDDPRWARLVRAELPHRSGVLALNIMLRNVTLSVKRDASPSNVRKNVEELRTFVERNHALLRDDIAALFH